MALRPPGLRMQDIDISDDVSRQNYARPAGPRSQTVGGAGSFEGLNRHPPHAYEVQPRAILARGFAQSGLGPSDFRPLDQPDPDEYRPVYVPGSAPDAGAFPRGGRGARGHVPFGRPMRGPTHYPGSPVFIESSYAVQDPIECCACPPKQPTLANALGMTNAGKLASPNPRQHFDHPGYHPDRYRARMYGRNTPAQDEPWPTLYADVPTDDAEGLVRRRPTPQALTLDTHKPTARYGSGASFEGMWQPEPDEYAPARFQLAGKNDAGDILPTIVWPDDARKYIAQVDVDYERMNQAVASSQVAPEFRAQWLVQYGAWKAYAPAASQSVGFFGVAAVMDQTDRWAAQLVAFGKSFATAGGKLVGPAPQAPGQGIQEPLSLPSVGQSTGLIVALTALVGMVFLAPKLLK